MPIDDRHYYMVGDRGQNEDVKNVSEKLIATESKLEIGQSVSKPVSQSCTIATTMNSKDKESDVNNKRKKTDFSNKEIVIVDGHGKHQTAGSQLMFNAQHKKDNVSPYIDIPYSKEYDTSIDQRLPDTVTLLTTPDGGKLYLVGTAHFSVESQNDVSMIIQAVQPHIVVVELCKARVGILQLDEELMYRYAKNLTYECIAQSLKEYGVYNGFLHILFLRMAAHVTEQLGMAPGGEFRRGVEEAKKIPNCIVHLADRPINITIQRAVRTLSWLQTLQLWWHLINFRGCISKEDVELCKQRSLLDEMISKLKEEFPALEKVFVKERDQYLTYSLQLATLPQHTLNGIVPARVVGIVGIGHTPGIMENWGKVKYSDIPPIMSVPPQALSTKILKFTVKASLLSAIVYVGYKLIPLPSGITFQSVKSSVEGLLKIMVSMEAVACTDQYEHATPDIMYVVNNIPGPGIDIEYFESEYSLGCSCTAECSDCSCIRGSANYQDGRILDAKLAEPIIECNANCTCRENCGNRLVQKGPLDCLIVSKLVKKGLGLSTSKHITKGQFICEYAGEVISIEEARRRVEDNKKNDSMNYVLVVSEHIGDKSIVTCIDPKYFGNIGRYANHSCQPNASLVPIRVEGVVPRLCLFASRDIKIGEEVTFNYAGGVANSVHDLSDTPCLCGSNNCFGYLPHNSI